MSSVALHITSPSSICLVSRLALASLNEKQVRISLYMTETLFPNPVDYLSWETGSAVRSKRIWVKSLPGKPLYIGGKEVYLDPEQHLDVDTFSLMLDEGHDSILYVDSWLCFDKIAYLPFIAEMDSSPLVVFAGDEHFMRSRVMTFVSQAGLPCDAFVDFGPKGIFVASKLSNLRKIIVPPESHLTSVLKVHGKEDLFQAYSVDFGTQLDACEDQTVKEMWERVKAEGKELRQEFFLPYEAFV